MAEDDARLLGRIEAKARQLGFDLVGIAPAGPAETAGAYRAWIEGGYHGEMAYLARPDAVARRADPARILPGVRTVVVVVANHHTAPLPPELRDDPARGILASYAWNDDYHDVLTPCLRRLGDWIEEQVGGPVAARAYVDTGPVLEREWAARAGLGFVGKNTQLIHPRLGSWVLLGVLLLAVEIEPGAPVAAGAGTCGRCTRCLDACPTGALVAPYVLDARRCLSYLTIEHKGPIPRELRPLLGNRVFGCDICQEVCPWNRRFARPTAEPRFRPDPGEDGMAPRLVDLLALDEEGFRRRFGGSPVQRAKRRGLQRNAAVAAGNASAAHGEGLVPALARALQDAEPLVRGHAAWALGQIGSGEAQRALEQATGGEPDEWVRDEIRLAREQISPNSG